LVTDPQSRLSKKLPRTIASLCVIGQTRMENRKKLIVEIGMPQTLLRGVRP